MLTAARTDLATAISALPSWPSPVNPPCVFVIPATNGYVDSQGITFGGEWRAHFDVVVIGPPSSDTAVSLAWVEDTVSSILEASGDYALTGVDQPGLVHVNGAELLGTVVHLSRFVHLE
jgi:hypothetical protein